MTSRGTGAHGSRLRTRPAAPRRFRSSSTCWRMSAGNPRKPDPAMPAKPFIIVAIDGGAASGKSSTASALSRRFNLLHADTGSYYRAVTSEMLRRGASPGDMGSVKAALADLRLGTRITGRLAQIEIAGRPPGVEIRSKEVNEAVSHFAA